jgi:hypothetical protein
MGATVAAPAEIPIAIGRRLDRILSEARAEK